MTDENSEESETEDDAEGDEVNISRLRQMAQKGDLYREELEIEDYYGFDGTLFLQPINDTDFLPIAAQLEARFDIDSEEAQENLEEAEEDGQIDPSEFDKEFVGLMHDVVVLSIDRTQGMAEGEDEEGIRHIVTELLQGGLSLVIAERALSITSDAGSAEKFRRDGGSE